MPIADVHAAGEGNTRIGDQNFAVGTQVDP